MKKMVTVESINSQSVEKYCEQKGIEEIELLTSDGNDDEKITIYQIQDIRVIVTNAEPIWEHGDPEGFADTLKERGINI
jgi:hypothetical protein